MKAAHTYCTFFVEGGCYGVDVAQVQEVLRYQSMTRVPLAPPVVRGLINLRGQIVTALELRRLLGLLRGGLELLILGLKLRELLLLLRIGRGGLCRGLGLPG